MSGKLLEEKIVEHCAPTLAGLKTANMFNYPCADRDVLASDLAEVNDLLRGKGVCLTVLRYTQKNALVYVFRPDRLLADLADPLARQILTENGYGADGCGAESCAGRCRADDRRDDASCAGMDCAENSYPCTGLCEAQDPATCADGRGAALHAALTTLRRRLAGAGDGDFPHEVGLFLGYPPEDVLGFIRQDGAHCVCSGIWKAYADPEGRRRLFARLRKCAEVYREVYRGGRRTLTQLTVAA